MEERTNLTEKEVCINMWKHIKEYIRCNHSDNVSSNIASIKYAYIIEHNMLGKWKNMCILCQKYDNECPKCPLQSCMNNYKTLWTTIINEIFDDKTVTYISPFTLEERLEACDKVIEAIEKYIPDDYKS